MLPLFYRLQPALGGDWEAAHEWLNELGMNRGIWGRKTDKTEDKVRGDVFYSLDYTEPSRVVQLPKGDRTTTEVEGVPLEFYYPGPIEARS